MWVQIKEQFPSLKQPAKKLKWGKEEMKLKVYKQLQLLYSFPHAALICVNWLWSPRTVLQLGRVEMQHVSTTDPTFVRYCRDGGIGAGYTSSVSVLESHWCQINPQGGTWNWFPLPSCDLNGAKEEEWGKEFAQKHSLWSLVLLKIRYFAFKLKKLDSAAI